MFVFSFRGLGFLVPAAIFAPIVACYLVLSLFPELETKLLLIIYGLVLVISPVFTYSIGRMLNRNGVKHAFGEIRFEHWGIVQFSVSALIVSLISLNMLSDYLESTLPLDSRFGDKVFLVYLAILVISPLWLFMYLKKKMRKMNADITSAKDES